MTAPFASLPEAYDALSSLGKQENDVFLLTDHKTFRDSFIDRLVWTSVFSEDAELKNGCRILIHALAKDLGVTSASHQALYQAISRGEVTGFTVPAFNIRALTYDSSRIIFRLAKKHAVGAFILELARSEMGYSFQDPSEFAASVLAGAVKEGYQGHVFLQGDHYQVKEKIFAENAEKELDDLKALIAESIKSEIYNIDIDASTLVDLSQPTIEKQQELNARITAELTTYIRTQQPQGVTISVGGEIGHIGDKNSTDEDFTLFMEQYLTQVQGERISKVSAQTGSSHGGMVDQSGNLQKATIDFSVIDTIGTIAKEKYHMGGVVQHGASTLPLELYPTFVDHKTLEIHLSTQFQNIIFDTMPDSLREKMKQWVLTNCQADKKPDWNDTQLFYKARKRSIGPFKKDLWDLPAAEKQPILDALEKEYEAIFTKLSVLNTKDTVAKYV